MIKKSGERTEALEVIYQSINNINYLTDWNVTPLKAYDIKPTNDNVYSITSDKLDKKNARKAFVKYEAKYTTKMSSTIYLFGNRIVGKDDASGVGPFVLKKVDYLTDYQGQQVRLIEGTPSKFTKSARVAESTMATKPDGSLNIGDIIEINIDNNVNSPSESSASSTDALDEDTLFYIDDGLASQKQVPQSYVLCLDSIKHNNEEPVIVLVATDAIKNSIGYGIVTSDKDYAKNLNNHAPYHGLKFKKAQNGTWIFLYPRSRADLGIEAANFLNGLEKKYTYELKEAAAGKKEIFYPPALIITSDPENE
ncbi:MAG: hypothetical protein JW841_13055 [Deltaproteobacteria bacterium]|nr:hypothetical protein [Deltaproteobacteria bacterium]